MPEIPEDAALVEAMWRAHVGAEDAFYGRGHDPLTPKPYEREDMARVLARVRAHYAPTLATLTASLAEAEARVQAMHRRAQAVEGALEKANELLALADSNGGKSSRNTVRYYRKWQEAEARAGRAEAAVDTKAAADVLAERKRQVEVEGWLPEHDDDLQDKGQMALAASCYARFAAAKAKDRKNLARYTPVAWPWRDGWWKPTTPRRDLVKAGALILAEIERLDRAALQETTDGR